jgi:hypothetical protein
MDRPSPVELLSIMEEHIAYFETMLAREGKSFEPELRVAREITEMLRSGEFAADQIAKQINSIDDHYNGSSW